MSEENGSDKKFILIRLGILFAVALFLSLVIILGMKCMNKGIDEDPEESVCSDTTEMDAESSVVSLQSASILSIPEEDVVLLREDSWEVSEVMIYVKQYEEPVVDYLPEAPTLSDLPYEALLLVKLWAEYSGVPDTQIEEVYVFNSQDTLYADLPVSGLDFEELCRTVDGRFVYFTRLYPLVSGNIIAGFENGIPIDSDE